MTSKLRYFGAKEQVLLGDRVEYTSRVLRRKHIGTVVCIPAKTALQLDAERKAPEDWLIRFDDGTYTGWMYHPEELQPNRRLRLIGRNSEYDSITNEELERQDAEISSKSGPMYDLIGCGIAIAAVVAVILLVVVGSG
jgi:hypothetical protein